jgi:hypothetical protein
LLGPFGPGFKNVRPNSLSDTIKSPCKQTTKTCVGIARFSAIGPRPQAPGEGAMADFGVTAISGTVAVNPTIFGLSYPEKLAQRRQTQQTLAAVAWLITISPQGLNLHGGPTPPYTIGDIGDI